MANVNDSVSSQLELPVVIKKLRVVIREVTRQYEAHWSSMDHYTGDRFEIAGIMCEQLWPNIAKLKLILSELESQLERKNRDT